MKKKNGINLQERLEKHPLPIGDQGKPLVSRILEGHSEQQPLCFDHSGLTPHHLQTPKPLCHNIKFLLEIQMIK